MKTFEKNLTEGSVLGNLIKFSLPFLISSLIQSLYNVADMLIVGKFCGSESMSGVNIGGQVTFILTNIVVGLCMGATVLIGQYVGSNNREALRKTTATIITLLTMLGAAVTVVMLIVKEPLLRLIQTPPESFAESNSYLTVTVIGIIFIFSYNALSAIMRGMGDSRSPLYFILIACVTNIVLDLVFVGLMDMAAFGAALATVIAQALSVILCILFMIKQKFQFDFKLSSFKIYRDQLKLIIKIGLPTCVQNGVTSLSFLFLTAIVNRFGVDASAAVGAVGKFNSFVFMPTIAMSASISTISAQNIGAGKTDRAIRACFIGMIFSVCVSGIMFAIVQLFPGQILRIFNDESAVIENGITYIRTFSLDYLVIPYIFCLNGLFIGGGHTMFTLINGLMSSVLLRVPACYILGVTLDRGLSGVGYGAPIASAGALLAVIGFFISGKWKVNKVSSRVWVDGE